MGQLDALGGTGGAGGVDQRQQVVETDAGGRSFVVEVRVGREQVLVAPGAAVAVENDQVLDVRQLLARLSKISRKPFSTIATLAPASPTT